MERLNIGAVQVVNASGVVSAGCAYIRGLRSSGKGVVGGCAITGDYGAAPMGAAVLLDADVIDTPLWWMPGGRGRA